MGRSVRLPLATLLIALGLGSISRADFAVTIADATITEGGTGSVDVLIRSTNPAGDPLSSFGFEFQVTPTGPGHLDFRNPQLDAQLGLSSYVFAGNSGDAVDGVAVGDVGSVAGGTNNQFVGGDETDSGGDITVTGDALLVRLDLIAATTTPPKAGDTFTISLLPGAFTGFLGSNNTAIPFTSTPGTVTITSVPVPEPTTLALLVIGSSITLLGSPRVRTRVGRGLLGEAPPKRARHAVKLWEGSNDGTDS